MRSELEPGQVWTLNGRTSSRYRALVLKLEALEGEDIVHIAVLNSVGVFEVEHVPFDRKAFLDSIDGLESNNAELPAFDDGYQYWKAHFLAGEAGVYCIKVTEALGL